MALMNEALRQKFPDASPQEIAWASQGLENLRQAIARFSRARLTTGEMRSGLLPAKVPPAEVQQHLARYRDPEAERRAVEDLRIFLHGLYGRPPTAEEMEAGIPADEALGVLPMIIGLAAIVGGAATLTAAFDFLTARETRIRDELVVQNPQLNESWLSRLQTQARPYLRTGAIVVAVGATGYLVWEFVVKKQITKAAGAAVAEPIKNPEEEDAEEEEEEEDEDVDAE